jgi:hypothetical protein
MRSRGRRRPQHAVHGGGHAGQPEGSCSWSREGDRNRAAASGSCRPRRQSSRAVTGGTPSAAASEAACGGVAGLVFPDQGGHQDPSGGAGAGAFAGVPVLDEVHAQPPHAAELLVAPGERASGVRAADTARAADSAVSSSAAAPSGSLWAPPRRLGDDLVHDPEPEHVGRGELEGVGGLDLPAGVAPENRRAALGRDHAVDGELLDQDDGRRSRGPGRRRCRPRRRPRRSPAPSTAISRRL